jgi:cytidylate kinase
MAARHKSNVFVGRGAQFFLPRERGLAVQIVAPMEQRVQKISEREQVPEGTALRRLMKRDRERREFVRQHFDQDVTDPHLYDLVINLEYVPVDWAVDLVVKTCQRRFGLA